MQASFPQLDPGMRLCSPHIIGKLASYAADDKNLTLHERLSVPRSVMPNRTKARLLNPLDLPAPRPAPGPSPQLRANTASVTMRSLPESSSEPNLFRASVSKLDLPLQASTGVRMAARASPRMGDALFLSRVSSELDASMRLSSIPSSSSIGSYHRRQKLRRGQSLMLSGGAPLHPETAWTLRLLQVDALQRM